MNKLESMYFNDLFTLIGQNLGHGGPVVIGIAGNIAVGKTTFAKRIGCALKNEFSGKNIGLVCTDSFLYPNNQLRAKNLFCRKGFPESYNSYAINQFVTAIQCKSEIELPIYDHAINDISECHYTIEQPDIIIVEGLITLRAPLKEILNISIFLEASQENVLGWYQRRCYDNWKFDETSSNGFANQIQDAWTQVDVPNYQQNVEPTKKYADTILMFNNAHQLIDVNYQQLQLGGSKNAVCN